VGCDEVKHHMARTTLDLAGYRFHVVLCVLVARSAERVVHEIRPLQRPVRRYARMGGQDKEASRWRMASSAAGSSGSRRSSCRLSLRLGARGLMQRRTHQGARTSETTWPAAPSPAIVMRQGPRAQDGEIKWSGC
jgi:hypothetical protein